MKKLIQGIVEFSKNISEEDRLLFARLALGQKPDALFIACSDSRVVPNLFASTNPGDLFVLRNMGNLIPPVSCKDQDGSAQAAIEFSLFSLKIKDIIVCGHSECGAMEALLHGVESDCCSHMAAWLKHGQASLDKVKSGLPLDPTLSELNQLSQINVLQQLEHIASYPYVQERLQAKQLRLHAWWFDIAKANVYCYEAPVNQFVLISDEVAQDPG